MFTTLRTSHYPVHPLILNRWAPRAFAPEPLTDDELMTIFEAGRWAQSSYNNQPWRFIYAIKGKGSWKEFVNIMVPFNQSWASHAHALVIVASKTTFDRNGKPSRTHAFDTGAALQNMSLQGASMDIVVHGMEGFDYGAAQCLAKLTNDYEVMAMCAIGRHGSPDSLPAEIKQREVPSDRRPLSEIAFQDALVTRP